MQKRTYQGGGGGGGGLKVCNMTFSNSAIEHDKNRTWSVGPTLYPPNFFFSTTLVHFSSLYTTMDIFLH